MPKIREINWKDLGCMERVKSHLETGFGWGKKSYKLNGCGIDVKSVLGKGMAMQDYRIGLRVGLKDLPALRTRIHRQIWTEMITFHFFPNTFLTRGSDALCGAPSHGASLCVSFVDSDFQTSHPLRMSPKQLWTASFDWVDAEVGPGPHPSTQPDPVHPPTPGDSPEWKASPVLAREDFLFEGAYDSDASTPTKEWWENPEGVCLQPFSMARLLFIISLALLA